MKLGGVGYGLQPAQVARMRTLSAEPGRGPQQIAPLPKPIEPATVARSESKAGPFGDLLQQALLADNQAQKAVDSYASGGSQALHETMLTLEKASINLTLLVNVRNKLLEAYRQVMRMS